MVNLRADLCDGMCEISVGDWECRVCRIRLGHGDFPLDQGLSSKGQKAQFRFSGESYQPAPPSRARPRTQSAKASSVRSPDARSSIRRTPMPGSGRTDTPFRRRKVKAATKAVRLLPSTKAWALAMP